LSRGPSNVASGKQYETGDANYDRFFTELYAVQYLMGQAPERRAAVDRNLASALGAAPQPPTPELVNAVKRRVEQLEKLGTNVRLELSGLDDSPTPTATVTHTGTSSDPLDRTFVSTLEESTRAAGNLLGDLRRAKPTLERLRMETSALEGGVANTFKGRRKQEEVRKNLADAERLFPLMAARADEVAGSTLEFLRALDQALGGHPVTPGAPAKEKEEALPKKPAPKPKSAAPKSAAPKSGEPKAAEPKAAEPKAAEPKHSPSKPAEPKPVAEAPAEAPAPKKPPAPPSDDFEP
jgi:hypothetical protein